MKITQIRTSEDDYEGKYIIEMDESQMEALTRILRRQESSYSDYAPQYTPRYAEASALSSFLAATVRLNISA